MKTSSKKNNLFYKNKSAWLYSLIAFFLSTIWVLYFEIDFFYITCYLLPFILIFFLMNYFFIFKEEYKGMSSFSIISSAIILSLNIFIFHSWFSDYSFSIFLHEFFIVYFIINTCILRKRFA